MLTKIFCKTKLIIYTHSLPDYIINTCTESQTETILVHLNKRSYKQLILTLCGLNLVPLKGKKKMTVFVLNFRKIKILLLFLKKNKLISRIVWRTRRTKKSRTR